ncbi:GNAT family N-acetyltransferase [Xenorhabdus bharatensis]|uniref:GNAT family N-acetyltransferase n=1 Tax=Xenorhabdus bharatensis TaxID=3136256 RepID=UPI0030F42A88
MFRSKSFNIPRAVDCSSLTRSKSISDMYTASVDMKIFITIKEVSPKEASRATDVMMDETMTPDDWYYFYSPKPDEDKIKWEKRYSDSIEVINYIARNAVLQSMPPVLGRANYPGANKFFFVAYFKGVPVGALQLSEYDKDEHDIPKVDFLATHCGIRGCGILLIEYAVNKSQQLGKKGKLRLQPYSGAKIAYMNMGFIEEKGNKNNLELHPDERTDKWIWSNNDQSYKCKCFCI